MDNRCKLAGLGLLLILSLTVTMTPVAAAQTAATSVAQQLPPLPEWPIIGPILRMIGVAEPVPQPAPIPDPNLPEFRISSWDDLDALDQIEPGTRVRVIASDSDVNRMAQEAIRESADDDLSFRITFEPNETTIEASADASLLRRVGIRVPALIRGTLRVKAVGGVTAAVCRPTPVIRSLQVNGWGIGLRAMAQRAVDTQLEDAWPDELCIERILLMEGEAAVEGYRVP
jgi:hypothetical protein